MSAPLRLHGYAVSNYFNIAHAALIEKGARFEVVTTRASQDEAFLAVSPMGKIPVLETPHGWLAETVAIIEYLEDSLDGSALHAADPFGRARERQLLNVVQMYVEVPVRSLFPGVFMGGENSQATVDAARVALDRAIGALRRLADPRPFLMGESLSYADLFAFYCLDIAERVSRFVYQRSILAEIGLEQWALHMAQRDSTRQVLANFDEVFAPYLAARNAAYQFQPTCYDAVSPD
ncbi:glutathione S-transferase family protein [Stutzerimonas stutzeri]|uniref:Glutathione S-transferase n=1 Tax=Stutzerimonas stutzeri TaxID=316 RepID=A0A6I6LQZ1_STUST|nr:glutathione S-transferase family protein [Stutzerimonas stutzeri]QGZ31197.1 glutathione S-transferase [Stutzerimonas stutzeri]